FIFFFFFSSRRRHTRSDRDWSSDVCSSDLVEYQAGRVCRRLPAGGTLSVHHHARCRGWECRTRLSGGCIGPARRDSERGATQERSEERRVGKEGGGRRAEDKEKKKERE